MALARAFALFLLSAFVLALFVGLFAVPAYGLADFATLADRNTRPTEPSGYDVNGTSVKTIVDWPGVRGVGNLGIGNGDVSLMKPETFGEATKSPPAAAEEAGNSRIGGEVPEEAHSATGQGFQESDAGAVAGEVSESEAAGDEGESLLPQYVSAASVIPRGEPYAITINEPFPHILNEQPVESGALYAKMLGLPLPGGRMVDIGIKSLGSEY